MIKFFIQNNKGHKTLSLSKGFTLVETLIAIAIFSTTIVAMMSVLGSGISNTTYAKNSIEASYLAQEGIEYARNMRDTDVLANIDTGWANFRDASIASISPPPPADAYFTRTIQKVTVTVDEVKISSAVSWTQGSGTYSVTFSENLFNWVEP